MVVRLDEDELIEHWTLVGDEPGQVARQARGDPPGLLAVAEVLRQAWPVPARPRRVAG